MLNCVNQFEISENCQTQVKVEEEDAISNPISCNQLLDKLSGRKATLSRREEGCPDVGEC